MYFVWDKNHEGSCLVETRINGESLCAERILNEHGVFVRDNRVLQIIRKVLEAGSQEFSTIVSPRRPFGIDSSNKGRSAGDLYLFTSDGDSRINRDEVPKGAELIGRWKVLLSKTSSEHAGQADRNGKRRVLSRIEVMPPKSVATESYLIVGPFESKEEAQNAANYLLTRFVRFLVSAILLTQNITRSSFAFVPLQDFSRAWTDKQLFKKYQLTLAEIELIESTIREIE
jgi:site-specific DNA-methyltransferase (adenine-specific)